VTDIFPVLVVAAPPPPPPKPLTLPPALPLSPPLSSDEEEGGVDDVADGISALEEPLHLPELLVNSETLEERMGGFTQPSQILQYQLHSCSTQPEEQREFFSIERVTA
jgi:hypothetical protein